MYSGNRKNNQTDITWKTYLIRHSQGFFDLDDVFWRIYIFICVSSFFFIN
jgi:hypothetical protein